MSVSDLPILSPSYEAEQGDLYEPVSDEDENDEEGKAAGKEKR